MATRGYTLDADSHVEEGAETRSFLEPPYSEWTIPGANARRFYGF